MTRGDVSLALSIGRSYAEVAALPDEIKATYWDLIEEVQDRQKGGDRG